MKYEEDHYQDYQPGQNKPERSILVFVDHSVILNLKNELNGWDAKRLGEIFELEGYSNLDLLIYILVAGGIYPIIDVYFCVQSIAESTLKKI